jgi:hypothetical protein
MIYGKNENGVWHDMASGDPPVTLCGLTLRSPLLTNAVPGDNRCKRCAEYRLHERQVGNQLAEDYWHYYRYEVPRG